MFTKAFRFYQVDLLNAVICFGLFPKEAKSGYFVVSTGNCLASTLDYVVMQMTKTNRGNCITRVTNARK